MKDMRKWSVAGVSAALLAVGGAPLMAQDYSGAFTFGYSSGGTSIDSGGGAVDGPDVSAVTLHGTMQVQFPDGFRLGARLTHVSPDVDGFPVDVSLRGTELSAGYALPSGVWFGVYSEDISVSFDNAPLLSLFSIGQHYYGIEGGTNVAGIAVKGFIGNGNDVTSYGLSGRYEAANFLVGGFYTHSDLSPTGFSESVDVDSYGAGGVYNINPQFAVFGGVANTSLSASSTGDVGDLMTYGIGVSYNLSSMTNLPLFASLEYTGSKVSDASGSSFEADLDGFTLSVTVPMGRNSTMVPENSVAAAALNPTHSAITQAALMAF